MSKFTQQHIQNYEIVRLDTGVICLVISNSLSENDILVAKIYEETLREFHEIYDISHLFDTPHYLVLDKFYTAKVSRVVEKITKVNTMESAQLLQHILGKVNSY